VRKEDRKAPGAVAVVLRFAMKRNDLASLEDLFFINEKMGFFPFVGYCRAGGTPHAPVANRQQPYDVIHGPVAAYRQTHVIKDSDQVGFHTARATSKIPVVYEEARGIPLFYDVVL
jgi:hypothetical protein